MRPVAESVRLDKWLWAARFFKTRSLATEAVKAGHIACNGVRSKPGRAVRVGDELVVRRAAEIFELQILQLSEKRGPAALARTLYAESALSRERRAAAAVLRRAERLSAPRPPQHRPDKHARRDIRKLLGR